MELASQFGVPEPRYVPPDLTVPLVAASDVVAGWRVQHAAGSGDAAYALCVLAMQAGDIEEAYELCSDADGRGSAEGAYGRALLASYLGAGEDEGIQLLENADRAGSAAAAYALAGVYQHRTASSAAEAAVARARERALASTNPMISGCGSRALPRRKWWPRGARRPPEADGTSVLNRLISACSADVIPGRPPASTSAATAMSWSAPSTASSNGAASHPLRQTRPQMSD